MSESNGYASAAEVLGQCGVRRYVDVELFGNNYRLQSLDAGQHETFVRDNEKKGGHYNGNLRIVVLCLVDGEGKQMFTKDDITRLKELDTRLVVNLAEECLKHSGLALDDEPEKN